jgi:hypothetical protein
LEACERCRKPSCTNGEAAKCEARRAAMAESAKRD